ncbi:MAG: PD-(D/E)XK nuclease family protein, partial [Gemmatimonadaceae bacterium]
YEQLLLAGKLADSATLFRVALEVFDTEAPFVLDGVVTIVPMLTARGLPGELIGKIQEFGAITLPDDPLPNDSIAIDLFAAATPSDEVREVCRRVMAEGLRWDEVEIVTTDMDTYGVALDALAQSLVMNVSLLNGVPFVRTRLGRALERWLAWLDGGLPADVLRQALEAGELQSPNSAVASTALARELRALRIGWGRERYEAALARLESGEVLATVVAREEEETEEFATRRASRERSLAALAGLLHELLKLLPIVPERGSHDVVRVSASTLALATRRWLELVPKHGQVEQTAAPRLAARLDELVEVGHETTTFGTALATLRDALADLRAWPANAGERNPWMSAGGMLHLTDVRHAGATGRQRTFVVGLDADRTSGPVRQDPLLPDKVRRDIAPDALATTADRRAETAARLDAALGALRGKVTLSFATSGSLDGRAAGPSSLLLHQWRLLKGAESLSFDDLRKALQPPVSAVPAESTGLSRPLDARDVWFRTLADGPLLLDGDALVRAGHPLLDAGLRGAAAREASEVTAYHGLVPDAGPLLDPAAHPERPISPSSLELLAACPMAWMYHYGMMLLPPQDPSYDPASWLDAAQRGSLLHEVYERFTIAYRGRQQELTGEAARSDMRAIASEVIAEWKVNEPPPSETVFASESHELLRAAIAFVAMERERVESGDRGEWREFEVGFGLDAPQATYTLPGGRSISIKGKADRVDVLPDGSLRVVDYKTGSSTRFTRRKNDVPFAGGRRLQPALYAAAIETVLGAHVSRFEYRFPTDRGKNEIVAYEAAELDEARTVIDEMLQQVRAGSFIATTDASDCRFCDYAAICRVTVGRDERLKNSPRAEWARRHAGALDVYQIMRGHRRIEADDVGGNEGGEGEGSE